MRRVVLLVALLILAAIIAISQVNAAPASVDWEYSVDMCGAPLAATEACFVDAPGRAIFPPFDPRPSHLFITIRHEDMDADDSDESSYVWVRFWNGGTGQAELVVYPCFDSEGGVCVLDYRRWPRWADLASVDVTHAHPESENGRHTIRIQVDWRYSQYLPITQGG